MRLNAVDRARGARGVRGGGSLGCTHMAPTAPTAPPSSPRSRTTPGCWQCRLSQCRPPYNSQHDTPHRAILIRSRPLSCSAEILCLPSVALPTGDIVRCVHFLHPAPPRDPTDTDRESLRDVRGWARDWFGGEAWVRRTGFFGGVLVYGGCVTPAFPVQ